MLLAIDVGNTQTNLGLFNEQGTLIHLWRMTTTSSNTPDELQMHLDGFFSYVKRRPRPHMPCCNCKRGTFTYATMVTRDETHLSKR